MGDRMVNNELAQMVAGMKQNERMEKIKKAVESKIDWDQSGQNGLKEMVAMIKENKEKKDKEEAEKKMRVIKYAVEHCGQEKYDEIYKKNKINHFKNKQEVIDYHQIDKLVENDPLVNKNYLSKLTVMEKYVKEIDLYTGTNINQDFEEYFDNHEKIAKVKNNEKKAVNFWINRVNIKTKDFGVDEKDMKKMPRKLALDYLKNRMRSIYFEDQIENLERYGYDYDKYIAYHNGHKETLNKVANAKKITWWNRLVEKFQTKKVYFKVGEKSFGSKTEKFDNLPTEEQRKFLEHQAGKVKEERDESLYDTIDSDMLADKMMEDFVKSFNKQMAGKEKGKELYQ